MCDLGIGLKGNLLGGVVVSTMSCWCCSASSSPSSLMIVMETQTRGNAEKVASGS